MSPAHEVPQTPLAQAYGEQGTVVALLQAPAPLQVLAGVRTFPLQLAGAQTVPLA